MYPQTYFKRPDLFSFIKVLAVIFCTCVAYGCDNLQEALDVSNQTLATSVSSSEDIYQSHCARCHSKAYPKAPNLVTFKVLGAEAIYNTLSDGLMREYAKGLSARQLKDLAHYLGRSTEARVPIQYCLDNKELEDSRRPPLQGFGLNLESTRFIPGGIAKLTKDQIKTLQLEWAFAYPGATRARSQPSYYAGMILVGGQDGSVYALDLKTGCAHWTFQAEAEVRNSISVSMDTKEPSAMFGDIRGNIYSINAQTGSLIWKTLANEHPATTITGSPQLYKNVLYVPLSSNEWASAADPAYPCCTFQGGIVAVDVHDGTIQWTTYSIPEEPTISDRPNSLGINRFHPAGAPVWNSPTIDEKRGLLYVGTGESYTSPAVDTSDAILAIDLKKGGIVWSYQATSGDAWNMACYIGGGPNCPEENGPDLDFGASPILQELPDGKEIILAGQKSAVVYALDPDNNGQLLWKKRLGRGGFAGGIHWGMATSNERLFVPIADTTFNDRFPGIPKPGLSALDPVTGKILWFSPAENICEEKDKPACDPGLSAAITAIPGVVLSGAFDGYLRAYDSFNGEILWSYNTNRSFNTISGEKAHGGSIEADGPIVVEGYVLVNSGYSSSSRMAGNVLLAFRPSNKI